MRRNHFASSVNLDKAWKTIERSSFVGNGYSYRFQKGVSYMDIPGILMGDWDLREGAQDHYSISNREEVINLLPLDKLWRLYTTPNGVHAFLMSEMFEDGSQIESTLLSLKCDPLYSRISQQRGGCAVRISPKPNRVGDYIARFWMELGEGSAIKAIEEIVAIHDSYLK
jgi:hypothetical protein